MKTNAHNFDKKCQLHLACAKNDQYRPVMSYIYFENGFAIATNGHIMVALNIKECSTFTDDEIEELDGKFLHWAAYAELIKENAVKITDEGFLVDNVASQKTVHFMKFDKYLNYNSIFYDRKQGQLSEIGMDISLISTLQKILPYKNVKFEFNSDEKSSILITDTEGEYKSKAVIMPVLIKY